VNAKRLLALQGLPNGLISYQKSKFGYILGALDRKILDYFIGIVNSHFLYSGGHLV
jgi:hypothetical protein